MSEPSQLYSRVRLSREKLDAFLASPFPDPGGDEDVLAWLENASYYGDPYTPETIRERVVGHATVGDWVNWLMEPALYGIPMPGSNDYDDAKQTWTLAALDFSENYDDYIAAVAAFREIANYKDMPGSGGDQGDESNDGLLIYGYLFEGGAVSVALSIQTGAAEFLDEAQAQPLIIEANAVMEALVASAGPQ